MNGRVPSLSGCRQQRAGEGDRRSAPPLDQRPSGGNHDAQDAKVEQQMNGTEMDDHLRERRRLDARAYQPVPYAVEGEPQGLERQRGPDPPTRGSYALHDVCPRSACDARSAQSTVRAPIHSGATRVSVCGLFGPFLSTPQSAKAYPGTARRRAESSGSFGEVVRGGPNGIRTRVSALRGPCPGPLDDGAARTMRQHRASGWLGEEDSNPRYVVQSHASYH